MRIPQDIETRIKAELKPSDALDDIGCTLRRVNGNWVGKNPFREDKHSGSFVVNDTKGFAKDFSTGKVYNAIDILMEGRGISYHEALRYGAAMLHIYIDDQPTPVVKACEPRDKDEDEDKPMVYWPGDHLLKYVENAKANPLLQYLAHLPLTHDDKERLLYAIAIYGVGTSVVEPTKGWTIWPYRDQFGRTRTAKLMKYKADGHRDKDGYNFNWMHSMTRRWKVTNEGVEYENRRWQWDNKTHRIEHCLFGLHLLHRFPNAEVCIVESEKTALICSAFYNMDEKLFMATGGKDQLIKKLWPLMDEHRKIVFYPDHDGYEDWKEMANTIEYDGSLSIDRNIITQWTEADGGKADIGDILIRMLKPIQETTYQIALRRFGLECGHQGLKELIELMNLEITD